ncbi:sigma-54-dependent Fis family transcriptional regulator [Desulforhabdus sp. TSK]|uniref:sigma-54-dependent Fis family transcriptional regulator n=1 Tax=Desulforhabdus sp. TSK TaxID=2925014 RepID=UPI001FC86091|nr:sigma-54-dependent Fis family transcriptional regulator [Desulforhabdus sp. TSK]GKT09703.1 hypothetical protein DSTSK_30080 [Desulforhabdus sp. TSK]
MSHTSFSFCKALSSELDPEKLHQKFLSSLLELQNVERGSIWVKKRDGYLCVEAAGDQSQRIKGVTIRADRPSIVGWVIENGKMTISEPGKDERHYKAFEADMAVKSRLILCFPLFLKSGEVYGAVQLIDTSAGGDRLNLDKDYLDLLQNLVDIGSIVLSNSLVYMDQVKENLQLKQTLDSIRREEAILGKSEAFLKVLKAAADYARTDFPVLITGESGTGKEVIAKEIHRLSPRADKPFLVQNCSAIPETLLESELFGYQKGAFTGAIKDKVGLFEAANEGTVFLDEIGDMPLQLQARILRIIQNSEIKPLGGTKTRKINVRILSATNKDLKEAIAREQFREDLFYRLNVLPLHLPPLRERKEDILLLLDHFLTRESLKMGIPLKKLNRAAMDYLLQYSWKGNIRELENFVKHIIVVVEGPRITRDDLFLHFQAAQLDAAPAEPASLPTAPVHEAAAQQEPSLQPDRTDPSFFEGYTWEGLEKAYVLYLLEKNRWHITRAAREAGVNRSTFDSRMKKLGIRK